MFAFSCFAWQSCLEVSLNEVFNFSTQKMSMHNSWLMRRGPGKGWWINIGEQGQKTTLIKVLQTHLSFIPFSIHELIYIVESEKVCAKFSFQLFFVPSPNISRSSQMFAFLICNTWMMGKTNERRERWWCTCHNHKYFYLYFASTILFLLFHFIGQYLNNESLVQQINVIHAKPSLTDVASASQSLRGKERFSFFWLKVIVHIKRCDFLLWQWPL